MRVALTQKQENYLQVKGQKKKKEVKAINRLLEITRFTIPYIKELKTLPLVKSTNACVLMQQLEYWMEKYPQGFFKFQAPPLSIQYAYKKGDSWTEELSITDDEFRTAFDQIGVRYNSKKDYNEAKKAGDEFRGRYYCSYFDKVSRLTHYRRNNEMVEEAIDSIVGLQNPISRDVNSNPTESTLSTSMDSETGFIEDKNTGLESTDTTANNNSEIITESEKNPLSKINNLFGNEVKNEEAKLETKEQDKLPINNQASKDDDKQTKVVIPKDFVPTWDAKYRAVLHFPNKSVSWATDKFISHYEGNGSKLTPEQWHQKWWDWMQTERETVGNEKLSDEHSEIIGYVVNDVFDCSYEMDDFIFDTYYLRVFLNHKYSEETLADVLYRLYEADFFGKVGDCYFNNCERDEWWSDIKNEIRNKDMLDEIIDIRSLPNNASLRSLLET